MINKIIVLSALIALLILNIFILLQNEQLSKYAILENKKRQTYEYIIKDGICNIGKRVDIDSLLRKKHFILRYDSTACMTCVNEAEILLENVFGTELLKQELCVVGVEEVRDPFGHKFPIYNKKWVTPMDNMYTPYFCVINDKGDVLFTLILMPDNYDYNREILVKLKKVLTET